MSKKLLKSVALVSPFLLYEYVYGVNYERLNFGQRILVKSIYRKWEDYFSDMPEDMHTIISYEALMNELNFIERAFVKKIFRINPADLGFKGPFYSIDKPVNLKKIDSYTFKSGRESGIQYCPTHSFDDFVLMSESLRQETGLKIHIDSGYRSPGRQAFVFFRNMVKESDYSLRGAAKWIAMPGYSEHGHPVNNAVDISNEDGINGFSDGQNAEDFEKLDEFIWLTENAARFNFYLSYPRENEYGVGYEPWHWHWEKKES